MNAVIDVNLAKHASIKGLTPDNRKTQALGGGGGVVEVTTMLTAKLNKRNKHQHSFTGCRRSMTTAIAAASVKPLTGPRKKKLWALSRTVRRGPETRTRCHEACTESNLYYLELGDPNEIFHILSSLITTYFNALYMHWSGLPQL